MSSTHRHRTLGTLVLVIIFNVLNIPFNWQSLFLEVQFQSSPQNTNPAPTVSTSGITILKSLSTSNSINYLQISCVMVERLHTNTQILLIHTQLAELQSSYRLAVFLTATSRPSNC